MKRLYLLLMVSLSIAAVLWLISGLRTIETSLQTGTDHDYTFLDEIPFAVHRNLFSEVADKQAPSVRLQSKAESSVKTPEVKNIENPLLSYHYVGQVVEGGHIKAYVLRGGDMLVLGAGDLISPRIRLVAIETESLTLRQEPSGELLTLILSNGGHK